MGNLRKRETAQMSPPQQFEKRRAVDARSSNKCPVLPAAAQSTCSRSYLFCLQHKTSCDWGVGRADDITGWGLSPSSLTCAPKLLDLMHPQPWQPKDKTGDRTSRDLSANMHTSTCSRADMCSLGLPVITCIQNNNNTKVRRKVRLASSIRNYTRNSIKIDIFYNAPMQ